MFSYPIRLSTFRPSNALSLNIMAEEHQKKRRPWLPILFVMGLVVVLALYPRSEVNEVSQTPIELTESSLSLPEEKIVQFVVNRLTDMLRIFPQS